MPDAAPPITVLMPAFNAARWIEAAVASVLAQVGPLFELLVIDDGSTDATPSLLAAIRDPRLRVIRQPQNLGLIASLNRGLAEARGEYVARLDSDDLCKSGRLAHQHEALRRDPSAVMATSFSELVSEQGQHVAVSRWYFTPEAYYGLLHFRNCVGHSTVMYRRSTVLAVGGYLDVYKCAEDFELWGRLARAGKIVCLPEALIAYRMHGASVSVRQARAQEEMAARIAGERLSALLGEPIAPALTTLYSEQAFYRSRAEDPRASTTRGRGATDTGELERAAQQFARALTAIWRTRPAYCEGRILRHFLSVEWARRFVSFRRRGVTLPRPQVVLPVLAPLAEGAVRGLLDEVHAPRLSALLPRTHP